MRSPLEGSGKVVVHTATDILLGEIVGNTEESLTLRAVSWVANTGRRSAFMVGQFDEHCEIEVYPPDLPVSVPKGSIVYVAAWSYALPTETR